MTIGAQDHAMTIGTLGSRMIAIGTEPKTNGDCVATVTSGRPTIGMTITAGLSGPLGMTARTGTTVRPIRLIVLVGMNGRSARGKSYSTAPCEMSRRCASRAIVRAGMIHTSNGGAPQMSGRGADRPGFVIEAIRSYHLSGDVKQN
jgi:hypothetical protein